MSVTGSHRPSEGLLEERRHFLPKRVYPRRSGIRLIAWLTWINESNDNALTFVGYVRSDFSVIYCMESVHNCLVAVLGD